MARNQTVETTTPLSSHSKKIGYDKDLLNHKYLLAFAYSDVDGTMYIEQSPDAQDWYTVEEVDITGGEPSHMVSELALRWARVKYENGAQPQQVFGLYTCFKGDR